jgi:hypothetical protein
MKGYAFLDIDNNLNYKPYAAINEDPGFFGRHRGLITKTWQFDTEDKSNFANMLRNFNDLQVTNSAIRNFLITIDYLKTGSLP